MEDKIVDISAREVTVEVIDERTGSSTGAACPSNITKTPIPWCSGARIWTGAFPSWCFIPAGGWSGCRI